MEFDLHSNVKGVLALAVQNIITNTTSVGAIVDTLGFESMEYLITSGTITDGAYALVLEQGDDSGLSDAAVVPTADILGVLTGFVAADDDTVKRVGSIGKNRIVSTGHMTMMVKDGEPTDGFVAYCAARAAGGGLRRVSGPETSP